MKKIIRYFLISILIIITLITGLSLITGYFFGDKVKSLVINEISNQLNVPVNVKKVSFSLLKRFPNAAIIMEDVFAGPSNGFDNSLFTDYDTDTLLAVKNLQLEFNVLDIYRGKFILRKIRLVDGKVRLFKGKDDNTNFKILKNKKDSAASGLVLELQKVSFEDIDFIYSDNENNIALRTYARDIELNGSFTGNDYFLKIKSGMLPGYFYYKGDNLWTSGKIKTNFNLEVKNDVCKIKDGILSFENQNFNISIIYNAGKNGFSDITINGDNIDIHSIIKNLPVLYSRHFEPYEINGNLNFNSRITGKTGVKNPFHIKSDFTISGASVFIKNKKIKIKVLKLKGSYSSGKDKTSDSSELVFTEIQLKTGNNTSLAGSGKIVNLNSPVISINADAVILLNDLPDLFGHGIIKEAEGNAMVSCNLSCKTANQGDSSSLVISDLTTNGTLIFDDAGMKLAALPYSLSGINGELNIVNNDLSTTGIKTELAGNKFEFKGSVSRIIDFLYLKNCKIKLKGYVTSPEINIDNFTNTGKSTDTSEFMLPGNIEALLDVSFDNLKCDKFKAGDFMMTVQYFYPELTVKKYSFRSMKGKVEGQAEISAVEDRKILVKNACRLSSIAIDEMFRSLNNFGQDYIMDKHLKGSVNADISLSGIWDSCMRLAGKYLDVEGSVEILNGELIDFGPMMSLSKFIEVSELKNIKFSKLKNNITISNRLITIPSMDISSSAFHISLSGTHDFDGNISYRVRVLLSELLGRKARNAKKENNEFGIIEDDGLGKTNLYLFISGNPGDYKISYDTRAAHDAVKQKLVNEKKEIKSILKDEFGLFRSDTSIKEQKKKEKNKKVLIEWNDKKEEPQDEPPE